MSSRRPRPASARVSSAEGSGRTAGPGASGPTTTRQTRFLWLAGAVFFLSGAAGLIYESIWSRYLGLLVGHTAYAQVIVLVIFMGGMAAGALAVGRRSERLRRPLRLYALVETAIGVLGLAFHPAYVALTNQAYNHWMAAAGGPPASTVIQWGLSAALILPQSVLLGTTFPLMSAAVVRRLPRAPGRVLGLLYFSNSLGAAAGVLASGFWLVGLAGLPGTVAAAAILNLLVAVVVVASQRQGEPAAHEAGTEPGETQAGGAGPGWIPRLLLAVSFGTALASFVYEIAWVRMLSLVLGSATHSFELMLSAFILGLALGAWWIRGRADRLGRPLVALATTQWAMGLLALATLPLYMASFQWIADLVTDLPRTFEGYRVFSLARYGICLAVMLPATFCAGITLPLITRILMKAGRGERAIGMVYGVNTLGSIAGASLAGLVLLPVLGLKGLLTAGAALDIALGLALFATLDRDPARTGRRLLPAAAISAVILVAAIAAGVHLDRLVLASGVYRDGIILRPDESQVLSYRDGRTATVTVRRQTTGDVTLSTNGKPDASLNPAMFVPVPGRPSIDLTDDESTQLLLGVISLAHRPDARRAAVIGQGSGFTSHVLLGSPTLSRVVTIEIEPEMIAASRLFDPVNRRVFRDPRSVFAIEDARSYLASTAERFDLIVSEPSNPWVSGVSGLFTDEFYARVRRSLTPDGVLGQWLHLYSLEDDLVLSVLAAIQRNFGSYEIYLVSSTDILIVATNSARGLSPDWSVVNAPGLAEDLRAVVPFTPTIFNATRVTDRGALAPLVERAPPNSDYFPRLDLAAERTRFFRSIAGGLVLLHFDRAGIASERARRVAPPDSSEVPLPAVLRVSALMWVSLLHATIAGAPPRPQDSRALRTRLAEAAARIERVRAPLATGKPPADWRLWMAEVGQAEDDLHRGTSGYADERFFDAVLRIAGFPGAPPEVRETLAWLHALELRDDATLLRLADDMIALAAREGSGVPADVVLGAAVRVRLAAGDTTGARRAFEALRGRLRRPDDFRVRLMAAHLDAAPR